VIDAAETIVREARVPASGMRLERQGGHPGIMEGAAPLPYTARPIPATRGRGYQNAPAPASYSSAISHEERLLTAMTRVSSELIPR
jgi:hypothetical protein